MPREVVRNKRRDRARRNHPPPRDWGGIGRWALLAGCGVLAVYLFWVAVTAPNATGLFDDDAVYQVTAKSIADGKGYRRIDRPSEPHQTKFPPLYPLILSAVWPLGGGFPGNIVWLRLPSVIATVLTIWLGVRYCAKYVPLGGTGLVLIALTSLTLPEWRLFSVITMSEPVFAALTLAALHAAERSRAHAGRRSILWAATAGLSAGLALLTRTVGVTLAAALVIWFVSRRRWLHAVLAAAPAVVCVAGWTVWTSSVTAGEATIRRSELLRYELDYFAWIPHALGDAFLVGWHNFVWFALIQTQMLLRIPLTVAGSAWLQSVGTLAFHLLVWPLLVLLIVGWYGSARERLSPAHVFVPLYIGAVLFYPLGVDRFILPISVLLAAFVFVGAGSILGRLTRRLRQSTTRRLTVGLVSAYGLTVLVLNVNAHPRMFACQDGVCRMGSNKFNLETLQRTTAWLADNTPAGAVIASRRSSVTALATGRHTVLLTPYVNPVAYHYSPNRWFASFYVVPVIDEIEAATRDARNLPDIYAQLGVTYLVRAAEDELLFAAAVDASVRAHPRNFRELWTDRHLQAAIFQVSPDP
jgi:hypothetical protein